MAARWSVERSRLQLRIRSIERTVMVEVVTIAVGEVWGCVVTSRSVHALEALL